MIHCFDYREFRADLGTNPAPGDPGRGRRQACSLNNQLNFNDFGLSRTKADRNSRRAN